MAGKEAKLSVEEQLARFVPVALTASEENKAKLSAGQWQCLAHIVKAARVIDRIYTRQAWKGNEDFMKALDASPAVRDSACGRYAAVNKGPWSDLDDGALFVSEADLAILRRAVPSLEAPTATPPPTANFYPSDMSKEEIEAAIGELSDHDREEAKGFFTVLRRKKEGENALQVVSYAVEYADLLEEAAKELEAAANAVGQKEEESLCKYLRTRAAAFRSNDYFESDVAWMELDSGIDVTIGPYEVYRDVYFSYKATFEAVIAIRDDGETAKLKLMETLMQELETNLPIPAAMKSSSITMNTPIKVVEEVFVSGDVGGPQTIAFCLPNDERVRKEKGSKLVILKNVSEAKHRLIMEPIAAICMREDQVKLSTFYAFFTHTLCHECCHSIGPHDLKDENGVETTVRHKMQELHSAVEEAKADIVGLWALRYLTKKGTFSAQELDKEMYVSFVVAAIRSVRFGLEEAHGKGLAMQFTYLFRHGGIAFDEDSKKFYVVFDKIEEAVEQLSSRVLTIQGEGSKAKAKALLDEYAVITPELRQCLDRLADVPVDIAPTFPLVEALEVK